MELAFLFFVVLFLILGAADKRFFIIWERRQVNEDTAILPVNGSADNTVAYFGSQDDPLKIPLNLNLVETREFGPIGR